MPYYISLILFICLIATPSYAENSAECLIEDRLCLLHQLKETAEKIEKKSWRDQTYRELAKSYTYAGYPAEAIALIPLIETPDTKAMTIRGIGMAAADSQWSQEKYKALFDNLDQAAQKIDHPPSHAIAYTYIAMSQAFAGDNEGAMKTALSMENDALRHKAFGESAEIQAEKGNFTAAMESIAQIDSLSFRNKAYRIVSKIFVNKGLLKEAYETAQKIDNPYTQAQALQKILNYGNAEEE